MAKTLCAGTYAWGHMYRSLDGGYVWTDVYSEDPELYEIVSIATDQSGVWCFGIRDLVTDEGKIYRSDDDGLTWSLVYTSVKYAIWGIATDKLGHWFAVTHNYPGVLYEAFVLESIDNGANWTINYATGHHTPHDIMYSIAYGGGQVWCIGGSNRIYRTDNNGVSWSVVHTFSSYADAWSIASDGAGIWCAGLNLWGASNGSIYRSTNDGVTWAEIYVTGDLEVDAIATDSNGIWCATSTYDYGKVYRSTDDGANWTEVYDIRTELSVDPSDSIYIQGMAQDDAGNWIIVSSYGSRLLALVSNDDGENWIVAYDDTDAFSSGFWCVAYGGSLCPPPLLFVHDVEYV